MYSAVEAFFHRIVDYAGLFPPARLDLPEALENYRRYASGRYEWMLGRFVIPAPRLDELVEQLGSVNRSQTPLSVILRPDRLREDLDTAGRLATAHPSAVDVSVAECRLPGEGVTWPDFLTEFDRTAPARLQRVYFELPGNDLPATVVSEVCESVAAYNTSRKQWDGEAGIKVRCGGPTPDDVPGAPFLADVITGCTRHRLRCKATAGLHHPVRNVDQQLNTEVFGFLNVFGAGIISAVHRIPADDLHAILLESDPSKFEFGPGHFSWGPHTVPISWIQQARESAIVSFGSCSFEEPVQDLKDLRLI